MHILKNNKFIAITVTTGIAMITWQLLVGPLGYRFQLLFFIVSMFTLGIPHGAFDYSVEKEVSRRQESLFLGFVFRLKYLAAIVVYAVCWYLFPQLSLVAFLLMSSWHFGQTDLRQAKAWPVVNSLVRLIYGISVLSWIIFAHSVESHTIIMQLIPAGSITIKLWTFAFIYAKPVLLVSGLILVVILTFDQLKRRTNNRMWLFFQLVIILSCGYFLPLLPAFVLYFVGWHSVVTLHNIKEFISGDITLKPFTTARLILKALPASLMSIGVLLLTGFLFRHYAPVFDPLPLLFVFLSLITLPHMQVMNKLNNISPAY